MEDKDFIILQDME